MRNSFLEVDIDSISYNIAKIKKLVKNGTEVMPVIKADAYGLGALSLKKALDENNIKKVAVAIVDEAIALRKNGFNQQIIILNELLLDETKQVVDYNLTPGVSVYEIAKKINFFAKKEGKIINIHIEVDTGMGRVGLKPEDMVDFVKKVSELENIFIEGIYTHFSSADSSVEYTNKQIEIFNNVINKLKENGYDFKYKHAAASSGILEFENSRFNMVRPGLIIYGYYPSEIMKEKIKLKPATKLKTNIVFIKEVPKGTAISYSRTYITDKKTKIATIPVGYADGIRRSLSNNGKVYINGKYANIIGNVCMDNFMVDVTNIENIKIGDEVILWDNENITVEEVAKECDTINYEILCNISKRIPRKYV